MTELWVNHYLYSSDFPFFHCANYRKTSRISPGCDCVLTSLNFWEGTWLQWKQMQFHKCRRNAETNYTHNSVALSPEWTRTQDSDMNKDWKWLEMLPLFSLTHTHRERNVVPNRAAQGALMLAPLGMLSFLFPPLYSSLPIPLSFFLLFSSQFLTAGRIAG